MKYFLTGASGFIGGRVARQLREAGHDVVALVRSRARAAELAGLGVTLHEGDVTEKESMRAPMSGMDGVFHIAGWLKIGSADRGLGDAVNISGTRNVLELMSELDIPRGVYTSTVAVFSDTGGKLVDESYHFTPNTPGSQTAGSTPDQPATWLSEYDRTKWQAHYEVAEPMVSAGLPLITVMPGLVYGPGDTGIMRATLVQYLQRKLPAIPARTAFCWAHADDTARGHLLAMERGKPGESYIITGPPHTLVEAFQIAERISGVPAPSITLPPTVLRAAASFVGFLERFGRLPLPEAYTAEGLRVTSGVTYLGDNAKARRELGFDPRPLEVGLRETLLHEMHLLGMRPLP